MFKQMQPFGLFCRLKIKDQLTLYEDSFQSWKENKQRLRPVFTSKKIVDEIKVAEAKPPLINQQCVVY